LKLKRSTILLFIGATALLLSACGPVHVDPKWASISTVGDEQLIAVAFGDRLTLIDPADGRPVELLNPEGEPRLDDQGNPRIWEFRTTDNQQTRFFSAPVETAEDRLLVGSYDRRLLEADLISPDISVGSPVTVDPDQFLVASPVVDDGLIFVGLSDHDMVALDADNPTDTIWRFSTQYGVWDSPVVVEDVIYFASMDHNLYALDKASGELLWSTNLQGAVPSSPLYADGVLYVGSFARKVFALDAATGEILAEHPTSEWVWGTPTLVDGTLYVADMGGFVYALRLEGGSFTEVWAPQVSQLAIATTPLVTDEFVIVGSRDRNVYWLDREDGSTTYAREVGGEVLADPLLVEANDDIGQSLVVVNTSTLQELLVAFTLDDGQRLWAYGR
jgi:outer membrane protein assembly factor BamB